MSTELRDPAISSAESSEAFTMHIASRPSLSPESDLGLVLAAAEQAALGDAATNTVDEYLLEALVAGELPSEQMIDRQVNRRSEEHEIRRVDNDFISEVLVIREEKSLMDAKRDLEQAEILYLATEAEIEDELKYLSGDQSEADGSSWAAPIPVQSLPNKGSAMPGNRALVRPGAQTIVVNAVWVLAAIAEAGIAYGIWELFIDSGTDIWGRMKVLCLVLISALALTFVPHQLAPDLARFYRGGKLKWRLCWIPLLAAYLLLLALLRANHEAHLQRSLGAEFGPSDWLLQCAIWLIILAFMPVAIILYTVAHHNPHIARYLRLTANLTTVSAQVEDAHRRITEQEAALRVSLAGRKHLAEMCDRYPDLLIAEGEEAKAAYRRELARQMGSPQSTGAIISGFRDEKGLAHAPSVSLVPQLSTSSTGV